MKNLLKGKLAWSANYLGFTSQFGRNWFGHLILILEDVPKKLMVVFAVVDEDVREWAALDFESTSVNLDNQNVTEEIFFEWSVLRLEQFWNLAQHHFELLRSDL